MKGNPIFQILVSKDTLIWLATGYILITGFKSDVFIKPLKWEPRTIHVQSKYLISTCVYIPDHMINISQITAFARQIDIVTYCAICHKIRYNWTIIPSFLIKHHERVKNAMLITYVYDKNNVKPSAYPKVIIPYMRFLLLFSLFCFLMWIYSIAGNMWKKSPAMCYSRMISLYSYHLCKSYTPINNTNCQNTHNLWSVHRQVYMYLAFVLRPLQLLSGPLIKRALWSFVGVLIHFLISTIQASAV